MRNASPFWNPKSARVECMATLRDYCCWSTCEQCTVCIYSLYSSSYICMHRHIIHARGCNKTGTNRIRWIRVWSLFGVQGPFRLVHAQSLSSTTSVLLHLYLLVHLLAISVLVLLLSDCSYSYITALRISVHRWELEVSPSRNQARLAPTIKSTFPKALGLVFIRLFNHLRVCWSGVFVGSPRWY